MKLDELIKIYPEINLTVNSEQLLELCQKVAEQTVQALVKQQNEKVYSRKEVVQKFGICEATLWRWTRAGLIESKKIGNRVFYPESEVRRLSTK